MSTIQANAILDASGGNTVTVNGVTPNSDVVKGRNIIINGAMNVAQRGTQSNQVGHWTACDRYNFAENGSSVVTTSQDTDVPSGQGFSYSLKVDVTTSNPSVASGNYALIRTKFEGQDLQHLKYGTSSAQNITLSFWVKSPKTGIHNVQLTHSDAGVYNAIQYTVNTANTWEKKTLTFSGYTSTNFDNDNNNSLEVVWWLMAGSSIGGGTYVENTWTSDATTRAVGQVNVMDDTANNFYLTGVKLEVGSVATEFDHRSYGEELELCKRYYQHLSYLPAIAYSSTIINSCARYSAMRANPTFSATGPLNFQGTVANNATQSSASVGAVYTSFYNDHTSTYFVNVPNYSGLTANHPGWWAVPVNNSNYIIADAEL